jgi:DNA-binding CsgD family transcriptional regulator
MALIPLALLHIFTGRFDSAAVLIEEADTIASAIGAAPIPYARVHLAAWRGRLAETTALIANTVNDATARGEGLMLTTAAHAITIQHIALGDYEKALSAAVMASDDSQPMYSWWALPDVVEAAVRTNRPDIARTASERLSSMATASGTEWALGMDARTQALVCADHAEAARLYRQAIERLERTSIAVDLARAHLLYGEMLRRDRRRVEARQHLRTANDMFSSMGAEAFVDRVAGELMATGERTGARAPETPSQLTPQQAQVARLASQGYTNSQIGARLFISPRTVEYHLRNVFMTLGITSRAHLANALEPPNRRGLAGTAGGQR